MSYLTYLFDLIFGIMISIKIPIPIYIGSAPLYLSIFTIFLGLISLGIILYFIMKLLGVGTDIFWHDVSSGLVNDLSKSKSDFNGVETFTIKKSGINRDGTNNYSINRVRRYSKKL